MKRGVEEYHGRPEPAAKHQRPEQGRFSGVSPYLYERLQGIFASGVNPKEIDEGAITALSTLSDNDGAHILDAMARIGPLTINNKSAFITERAKRVHERGGKRREGAGNHEGRGRGRGGGPARGRGPEDNGHWVPGPHMGPPAGMPQPFQEPMLQPVPQLQPMPGPGLPQGLPQGGPQGAAVQVPPQMGPQSPGPRIHQGLDQLKWGVRVDEFLTLSPHAAYVHPAAALRMQQLWDEGNPLVSLMDDRSFEALSTLDAKASVECIERVVAELPMLPPDDIAALNNLFMGVVAHVSNMAPATGPPPGPAPGPLPMNQARFQAGPELLPQGPPQVLQGLPQGPPQGLPGPPMMGPPMQQPIMSGGPPFADHPNLSMLPPEVQHQVAVLVNSSRGLVAVQHFDKGVVERFLDLPLPQQLQVVEDLLHDDVTTIRNPTAYIHGIIRRYARGVPSVRGGQGRHGNRPPGNRPPPRR